MYRIEITDRAKKEIAAFKRSDIASYKKDCKVIIRTTATSSHWYRTSRTIITR